MIAPGTDPATAARVERVLAKHVPAPILRFIAEAGTSLVVVTGRYDDASPALREMGVNVDGWPSSPAGLFVVPEATLYVRNISTMTIVHELGHAFDLALGGGTEYLTTSDTPLRLAYAQESRFVTPYAASAVDEYFAESFRAMCEANDERSPWPDATRERLSRSLIAPIISALFERFASVEVAA